MSQVHVTHIRRTLEKIYTGIIDLSDCEKHTPQEKTNVFLSRSLAAYSISHIAEIDDNIAAKSVVDGAEDNGIDAIYIDKDKHIIYIAQSKWISSGNGSLTAGDIHNFVAGFQDLLYLNFDRFNDKIAKMKGEITSVLVDDPNVHFTLIIAYTGKSELSKHANRILDDLIKEHNDPVSHKFI